MRNSSHVVIVGAGLCGALLACQLGERGFRVTVCERRPDPRARGFLGGRSINLALSCRGITALQSVGLADRVLEQAVRMAGRMMHDEAGELTFQRYSSRDEDAINSISRGDLNLTLLNHADTFDHVELRFGRKCVGVDFDKPAVTFATDDGERETIAADAVIAADGAFSAVRYAMQKVDRFNYSQNYLPHGYKELSIPPRDGEFAMEPHALHIWPRGTSMMIALPNADRSFTCTLFWPMEGPQSFQELRGDADILPYFQEHFGDAAALMPTLVRDYQENPTSSLVTIRCGPWSHQNVLLIGDAAHAIVPFYGQGINAGFEDCRLLCQLLDDDDDWQRTFERFYEQRKTDAEAIADMAIDNFVEMRDHVASPDFLLRKRIEHALHSIDSEHYMPLYNRVSFTNEPYAEARQRGKDVIDLATEIRSRLDQTESHTWTREELEQRVRWRL